MLNKDVDDIIDPVGEERDDLTTPWGKAFGFCLVAESLVSRVVRLYFASLKNVRYNTGDDKVRILNVA